MFRIIRPSLFLPPPSENPFIFLPHPLFFFLFLTQNKRETDGKCEDDTQYATGSMQNNIFTSSMATPHPQKRRKWVECSRTSRRVQTKIPK